MTDYTAVAYRPVVPPGEELVFAMVKPDGTARDLSDQILKRLAKTGLALRLAKYVRPMPDQARAHFSRKNGSSGTTEDQVISYLTSGYVHGMVWQGKDAGRKVRALGGDPRDLFPNRPGTVRSRFAADSIPAANVEGRACHNVMHSSNNGESALYEITAW